MVAEIVACSFSAHAGEIWMWMPDAPRLEHSRASFADASLCPAAGDQASGHGVRGTISAVPERQPLGGEGVWRISLGGEPFGRLVRRAQGGIGVTWQLLQINDLSDEQLDAYEAAMLDSL